MRNRTRIHCIALCVAAIALMITLPIKLLAKETNTSNSAGSISIDGDLSDWSQVDAQSSQSDSITEWKAVLSEDQETLYISYSGDASSEWDYNYLGNNPITITYEDGTNDNRSKIQFAGWSENINVKDGWYADVQDSSAITVNEAHGNTAGPYTVEASIPMSFFGDNDFTMTFAGTTLHKSDIPQLNGSSGDNWDKTDQDQEDQDQEDQDQDNNDGAVYTGIVIDGNFSDWDAVTKSDATCPNESHPYCLSKTAMVFDGDYVYIYIKDGKVGDASGAGNYSNGKYSIQTDLGREILFQLCSNGTINGIDGAECVHYGSQWEISIPASALPQYQTSISFGLYQEDPFVTGVVNMDNDSNSGTGSFSGIVYDGLYGDWNSYPHTTISYATAGTSENVVDAQGALYSSDGILYGHVVTSMPAHLSEAGGEFAYAVSIIFNNNWNTAFYPRLATVDENGVINWNPQVSGLCNGTYEFYLFSSDAWGTSGNINDLNDADQWYGKITMTISPTQNECEFYLDLSKIAKKLGCETSDFKTISGQFGRIGQQYICTAGASSGAWLGVVICIVFVGGVLIYRKRKSGVVK